MDKLPVELLTKIVDYLPPQDQVKLQSVSKRFFDLARDNTRWRLHCYQESWSATQVSRSSPRTVESLARNLQSPAPLSSLGQSSLRSLIQPQSGQRLGDSSGLSSHATQSRAAAAWDPSYEKEDVDWYSEYIARHGPVSLSWLQQPYTKRENSRRKEFFEVKGIGLLRDWSSARGNKVVAPLEDGSVCIWDLNHSHCSETQGTKGKIIGMSAPGILMTDMSRRKETSPVSKSKAVADFVSVGECVSVDSIRRRAYLAVGNILNEVDLETLKVVSQQRYPWSIFALSQETDYSVPLTLATTLSLQIYDSRLSAPEEEETINLRCEREITPIVPESRLFTHPDSPLLQLQPNGLPPRRIRSPVPSEEDTKYAPLFQPGPLSILHPPAPHVNTILLAGRFPSILCYDRRFFPRLQNTVHSGGRLCALTSVPPPQFPLFSDSTWPTSHTIVACGEYNGRGSLELYNISSSTPDQSNDLSDMSSDMSSRYRNRQSAAKSKLLSVQSHGTRIVYSDAEGNIKWVERDGRVEVRRFNINTHQTLPHTRWNRPDNSRISSHESNSDGAQETTRLFSTDSLHSGPNEVARRILPTGGNLTGDELLVWTGERIGRVRFSPTDPEEDEDEVDDMSIDEGIDEASHEELRLRYREREQREREYAELMRKALERQADEVRWMGRLGMA
ncbi:hypothetical protein MPDQ_000864 [Monascus purpureus]|uniref:F-box domain-containing protein n=1 Tax=Monascus purpureus TaxID=5098 RepID=A0A507R3M0_MONPU|nr:hypothetical protein MPDQ_000864 [Monascus purpureus]BDD55677.1 hypothetical protein MAP00_001167 [Monascus purpureus]